MKNIDELLCESIERVCPGKDVAVMFSGGVDSHSIAFACNRLGKNITTYSFRIKDIPTYDSDKAKETSDVFGWKHVRVEVPVENLEKDFLRLYNDFGCVKKTQFECLFPFLYVFPQVKEDVILSGVHADKYYGLSREANVHYVHDKKLFDDYRRDGYYDGVNNKKFQYHWHVDMAKSFNKQFYPVYLTEDILNFFLQFDHKEMHVPEQKNHVREAFKEEFSKCGKVKKHWNYQLCAGIPEIFQDKLISNPIINFKNRKRMMEVYRDWARLPKQVDTYEDLFDISKSNEVQKTIALGHFYS